MEKNLDGELTHLKTGNTYRYVGEAIDATDALDGRKVVIYRNDEQTFVREKAEFWQKFQWKVPSCCVCGATEGLRWDGPWYGYRCGGADCQVF